MFKPTKILCLTALLCLVISHITSAQQDPQYTQYMYNTQIVNPAYAGSRGALNIGILGRTQWMNLEGAPETGTLSVNSPVGRYNDMGLGLSLVYDKIGPATESNLVMDWSYKIYLTNNTRLAFGLKAGLDMLNVDYSKLNIFEPDDPYFQVTIDNKIQPQLGSGLYVYSEKFYAGLSVPNFLNSKHFDENSLNNVDTENIAVERLHYFFITGYVFNLNRNLKFKPTTLVKYVSGAPLQWDIAANFMFNEKFVLGASYRWSASFSAMTGFQISRGFFAGLAYDYQSTNIQQYSNGSFEAFLRLEIFNRSDRILTPRFF
ncbi:PorP/SprF family type IX secretion system membrane protein [Flagellimonas zhangzhouensis]|uniref:Type IX secretion system membrane protein, PorP/SprF family n=1 Tax=Flagellimonas zhangzhouensis TaxID=1073328 RepID=A0A1H2SU35_9FLAO|nr:type IX secretion system membrane protein PorP/SprF [Allomuricauda zhangzhouensis]SDQ78715.1 type IX secretion system membrane protein, PorP/SprF family [Allomuricauda zhangzhouensis]SDW34544.1 type IX secretion system membrane protein, PorP/SprF family [Allomuricauda zhangzhouensis]